MTVRQTSILSFDSIQPVLNGRYLEYLSVLRGIGHPASDREVCEFAGVVDPNYFRPRRKELVDMGVIVEVGRRVCSVSGMTVCVWWFNGR